MKNDPIPVCIVHIDGDGNESFYVCGPTRMLIVDERAPHDRVYEITSRLDIRQVATLVGGGPIGSANDERHEAISAAVIAHIDGRKHLSAVPSIEVSAKEGG